MEPDRSTRPRGGRSVEVLLRPPRDRDRTMARVLIADDDDSLREMLAAVLARKGYDVEQAGDAAATLRLIEGQPLDLVLLDLRFGSISGLELLPRLKTLRPEMSVIVITAAGTIEAAVEAMRLGADNFLAKPIDPPRLVAVVEKGVEAATLRRRAVRLERLQGRAPAAPVGRSSALLDTLRLVDAVAGRDTTVLFTGETGTGKGLLARRLHESSARRAAPFVALNAAGLDRELLDSELFGHEKGAFTGAHERKLGLFEVADGGTLFLDEIGEMELGSQAKLLKVLEERRFRRIGGTAEIGANIRLVAATHRDLEAEAAAGRFRQDLLFRLNVFPIHVPPLRERTEDIVDLARHFLDEHRGGEPGEGLSSEAVRQLEAYAWPGNVRELRNAMERAAILCPPERAVTSADLPLLARAKPGPPAVSAAAAAAASAASTASRADAAPTRMDEAERALIERTLKEHGYNVRATARALGIARNTLYRKAKNYDIPLE